MILLSCLHFKVKIAVMYTSEKLDTTEYQMWTIWDKIVHIWYSVRLLLGAGTIRITKAPGLVWWYQFAFYNALQIYVRRQKAYGQIWPQVEIVFLLLLVKTTILLRDETPKTNLKGSVFGLDTIFWPCEGQRLFASIKVLPFRLINTYSNAIIYDPVCSKRWPKSKLTSSLCTDCTRG